MYELCPRKRVPFVVESSRGMAILIFLGFWELSRVLAKNGGAEPPGRGIILPKSYFDSPQSLEK